MDLLIGGDTAVLLLALASRDELLCRQTHLEVACAAIINHQIDRRHLPACLPQWMSVYLSVYLFIYLSIYYLLGLKRHPFELININIYNYINNNIK